VTACGGGSGGGTTVEPNTGNIPPVIDTSGQYDLVDYLFNETLSVTLNSVSYPSTFYNKADGVEVLQYTDKYEKTLDDTIVWSSDGTLNSTFVITPSTINETVHSANNALRTTQRFVNVGDVYMNANETTPIAPQNATCKVVNHHPSIDLGSLTGAFSLATGIYNDVLEVSCVTSFVIEGTNAPHTTLTHYFSRGVGVVLTEGSVIFFGDVYLIPTI